MYIQNKYSMTIEENIFLARRNLADYIWKSANLEGIAVTYPQTEIIIEGLSIGNLKISEINAIVNLKHAWHFILETIESSITLDSNSNTFFNSSFDFSLLSQINKIIGNYNIIPHAGELRLSEVKMGGTNWKPCIPEKEALKENIQEINKKENPTDRALTLMLYLMRTQAFYDGNKRTAMLAGNYIMVQNGAGIISISLEKQEKFRELLIHFYENNTMDEIKNFLYQYCIDGIHFPTNKAKL